MKQRRGQRCWRVGRILFTLALVAWLVTQVELAELMRLRRVIVWPLIGLALGLQLAGVCLSAFKWWLVLRGSNQVIPYRWAVQAYFIGQFFNNFLPTMIGGDAIRVYQLSQRTHQSGPAVASVFIKRVTGFFTLTVIAAGTLGWCWPMFATHPEILWGALGCVALASGGVLAAAFVGTLGLHRG